MGEFREHSLEEIEDGIRKAQSFEGLINNLRNMQSAEGNHRQIFDIHMREITDALDEIKLCCEKGVEFDSIRYTRFNELPDSLVKEKAVELASQYYESDYTMENGKIIKK
jgi:hypothetical protein